LRPLNDSSGEGPPLEAIFEDYSGETDGEVYLNEVRLAYFMSLQADAKKKKKEMVSIEVSLDASADEATDFDDSFCPGPFLAFNKCSKQQSFHSERCSFVRTFRRRGQEDSSGV